MAAALCAGVIAALCAAAQVGAATIGPPVPVAATSSPGPLHRKILDMKTGSNPKQVAFTPDGQEVWVPDLGGKGVQVFSVATGKEEAHLPLGTHGAVEVIFTRDGTKAYVSQMETATVYEIDRPRRVVLRVLKTGGNWTKVMVLSPDEATLYAANWVSNDISEIDLTTGTLRRLIKTVKTPRGLALDPTGTAMYVAGFDGGDLVRIDLTTLVTTSYLHTGGAMRHLVMDSTATHLYADDMGSDTVFAVDLASSAVRTLARTDSHPNTIDLDPTGRVLYVSSRGQNNPTGYGKPGLEWGTVLAIDTTSGAVLDAMVGGNQPTGLDVSPDGTLLAFTDFMDNRVELFAVPPMAALLRGNPAWTSGYRATIPKTKATQTTKATAGPTLKPTMTPQSG